MNVYDRLIQDHNDVRGLFAKLDQPEALEEFGREELYRSLRLKMIAHSRAEEQTFYDLIRNNPSVHDLIQDSFQEHREVTRLMEDVETVPPDDDRWLESMRDVRQHFLHHADEEEQQVFPRTKAFLSETRAEEIGDQFHEKEVGIFAEERQRLE